MYSDYEALQAAIKLADNNINCKQSDLSAGNLDLTRLQKMPNFHWSMEALVTFLNKRPAIKSLKMLSNMPGLNDKNLLLLAKLTSLFQFTLCAHPDHATEISPVGLAEFVKLSNLILLNLDFHALKFKYLNELVDVLVNHPTITMLTIKHAMLGNCCEKLANIAKLQILDLSNNDLTENEVVILSRNGNRNTNVGYKYLSLRYFLLGSTRYIIDNAILDLTSDVIPTFSTIENVIVLLKHNPQITTLKIRDKLLRADLASISTLAHLSIVVDTDSTSDTPELEAELIKVAQLKNIKSLAVTWTWTKFKSKSFNTQDFLAAIANNSSLTSVSLTNIILTNTCDSLAKSRSISQLNLVNTVIGDKDANLFFGNPYLTHVNFSVNCIYDEGASALFSMPNLVELDLTRNYIDKLDSFYRHKKLSSFKFSTRHGSAAFQRGLKKDPDIFTLPFDVSIMEKNIVITNFTSIFPLGSDLSDTDKLINIYKIFAHYAGDQSFLASPTLVRPLHWLTASDIKNEIEQLTNLPKDHYKAAKKIAKIIKKHIQKVIDKANENFSNTLLTDKTDKFTRLCFDVLHYLKDYVEEYSEKSAKKYFEGKEEPKTSSNYIYLKK